MKLINLKNFLDLNFLDLKRQCFNKLLYGFLSSVYWVTIFYVTRGIVPNFLLSFMKVLFAPSEPPDIFSSPFALDMATLCSGSIIGILILRGHFSDVVLIKNIFSRKSLAVFPGLLFYIVEIAIMELFIYSPVHWGSEYRPIFE